MSSFHFQKPSKSSKQMDTRKAAARAIAAVPMLTPIMDPMTSPAAPGAPNPEMYPADDI